MEQIETESLLLRPIRAADVEALVALWTDPEVTRHLGGPRDPAQLRETFEAEAGAGEARDVDLWPVVEKASGRVVGHCGLLEKEIGGLAEVELIYVFARGAWGKKGYATEAARALMDYAFGRAGLRRVVALIDPENAASERVAAKLNMRYERDVLRPGGKTLRLYAAGDTALNT